MEKGAFRKQRHISKRNMPFANKSMFQIERRLSQTKAYFKKKYAFRKQPPVYAGPAFLFWKVPVYGERRISQTKACFKKKGAFRKQRHVSNRKTYFANNGIFQKEIRIS